MVLTERCLRCPFCLSRICVCFIFSAFTAPASSFTSPPRPHFFRCLVSMAVWGWPLQLPPSGLGRGLTTQTEGTGTSLDVHISLQLVSSAPGHRRQGLVSWLGKQKGSGSWLFALPSQLLFGLRLSDEERDPALPAQVSD